MWPRCLACQLLLLVVARSNAEWSFGSFFAGEWDLQRQREGTVTRARYSLRPSSDGSRLEGTYFEHTGDEDDVETHTNRMIVEVEFSDPTQLTGSFKLARVKAEKWDTAAEAGEAEVDEEPTPQPVASQPKPRPVFNFAFTPRLDGNFWLSETPWLPSKGTGGKLQLVTVGNDVFIISQVSATDKDPITISTWTAMRRGSTLAPPSASSPSSPRKRTLFQRYGWYLGGTILLLAWRQRGKSKKA